MDKSRTLILIDDDDIEYMLNERRLRNTDWKIIHYPSAEELLKVVDSLPKPDLLMSDLRLPGMNGLELLRVLCQHKTFEEVSLVLTSATEPPDEVTNAVVELGASVKIKGVENSRDWVSHLEMLASRGLELLSTQVPTFDQGEKKPS